MLSIDKITEILQPLYELIKDKCYGFLLCGSSSLPWIKNKHDYDVAIIFKSKLHRHEIDSDKDVRLQFNNLKKELNVKYSISLLSRFEDSLINRAWNYQNHYFQVLIGDIPFDYSYDIFNREYVNILKSNFEYVSNEYQDKNQIPKFLYHILTGIYMIQNNSYELTEEQIENINIVHDMEDKEKIEELFNYCKEWLNNHE